jgi:CubicO group peptidase (beta-lactamase class C family)
LNFGKLENFIFEKMSDTHLPGLSVAAIMDGNVVYSRGFGFRNLQYGLGATRNTLYGIGSVTKSFTALAIMQLVEKGKLGLDDPISKHLSIDLKAREKPVQIRHLLSHTSGIPALAYAEALIRYVTKADDKWIPVSGHDDVLTFMNNAEQWALARPGERWFYLNEGYLLLGYIIEKVFKLSYREYIIKKILEPLQMKSSYFKKEEVEKNPEVATPYVITRDGDCLESRYTYGPLSSDGGLISNVSDLTNYLRMYIERGAVKDTALVSRESMEAMEKPRIDLPLQVFPGEAYGFGLHIIPDFFGNKLIGHGGSVLVSTAYIGYLLKKRIGIALLANGSGYPMSQLGLYGLALMCGEEPEELPFVKIERTFERLEGKYETYKGTMKAQVVSNAGILNLEIKDKYMDLIIPLIPENLENDVKHFYTVQSGVKLPVEFMVSGDNVDLIYERYRLRKVGTPT